MEGLKQRYQKTTQSEAKYLFVGIAKMFNKPPCYCIIKGGHKVEIIFQN
jgi:hypothetical protein